MKQSAALLALVLLPAMAHAECVELTYSFEGRVLSDSGKPAAGALVGVSWLEFGQAAGPAVAVADSKGFYRLSVRFRPNNDMPLIGPACTDRLDHINIIAYTGDQRSYPTQVQVSGLKQKLPSLRISESAASPWSRPG
ncbi:carboxypeptidase-like regulatory domain-containing protein [Roseateles sp.]|uniref:carboxypeptidase-like regulatory domain-containing protein n=1 Tax=Roseateles sp. TaxID=1971397 RepID=UPI0032664EC3